MIKSLSDLPAIRQYLERIEAEPRTLRTAVVKRDSGKYWEDLHVIKLTPDGDVSAPAHLQPTPEEALAIRSQCKAETWPENLRQEQLTNLPDELKSVDSEKFFEFRDRQNKVIMLQVRHDQATGKAYHPWSYWTDCVWRNCEPDGQLPLWGLPQLSENTTVFIHEGAKSARFCQRLIEDESLLAKHPWGEKLAHAAHLGWIGGALSPGRTDWEPLNRAGVTRAYIVADNDKEGKRAVAKISRELNIPVFSIEFTDLFPGSFDLADPFPETMFKERGGRKHYIGPSFEALLHPATFATSTKTVTEETVKVGKDGKEKIQLKTVNRTFLRKTCGDMWAYVENADKFVCLHKPELMFGSKTFANYIAPFTNGHPNIVKLFLESYKGRTMNLVYRPDKGELIVTDDKSSAINIHQGSSVEPIAGDVSPWLDFMAYLIPVESDRREVLKWCATLIAKPDVRMLYGLLLVSEMQGIGKNTLGTHILLPLVGKSNVSSPSEADITNSAFNSWIVCKRLVIINEIYSGHSWKAYNRLKEVITEPTIEVNEKYEKAYTVDNWAHLLAMSNSKKALKIEKSDRRWLIPTVAETRWPKEKFNEFYEWLQFEGLGIVLHWAMNFGDYVALGDHAPMSLGKQEMIQNSDSDAILEISDILEGLKDDEKAIANSHLMEFMKSKFKPLYDNQDDFKKVFKEKGWQPWAGQLKIGNRAMRGHLSPKLIERLETVQEDDCKRETIRKCLYSFTESQTL
jgi:Family of unknown function (DUF5906)